MALLIRQTLEEVTESSPTVAVHVDRHTLYKRRWRAAASDGTELAVDLEAPVKDRDLLLAGAGEGESDERIFQIQQTPEEVLVIPLPDTTEMAAKIGWYLGNQHLPVEIRDNEIILERLDTLAASLDRIGIPYEFRVDVFRCKIHSSSHQH